jgi:hypothetical protein
MNPTQPLKTTELLADILVLYLELGFSKPTHFLPSESR